MKIAISNIAWQISEEESIAKTMVDLGIKGVEVAPTKMWDSPLSVSDEEIKSYRNFWEDQGIAIVSLQALLFGRQDLKIFADREKRQETFEYLSGMIELAHKLGAKVLVFGSPKNRSIGNLDLQEAEKIGQEFFYNLGEVALKNEVTFCIEPNPTVYNCNFITNSQQGIEFVLKTNNQGFGLHLDSAGMTLSNEDIKPALEKSLPRLCHFHISEPYLGQVGDEKVDHQIFADTLRNLNYQGWTSIEMKAQSADSNILPVTKALKTAIKYYQP